jgi:hypothetical protein
MMELPDNCTPETYMKILAYIEQRSELTDEMKSQIIAMVNRKYTVIVLNNALKDAQRDKDFIANKRSRPE